MVVIRIRVVTNTAFREGVYKAPRRLTKIGGPTLPPNLVNGRLVCVVYWCRFAATLIMCK